MRTKKADTPNQPSRLARYFHLLAASVAKSNQQRDVDEVLLTLHGGFKELSSVGIPPNAVLDRLIKLATMEIAHGA